nr:MAG TPA: hypothetical protein [Caudoviricetes sp.]
MHQTLILIKWNSQMVLRLQEKTLLTTVRVQLVLAICCATVI